jgi:MoaA/NifB/PqqE/SkfB family radical SAM enzyme
MAWSAPIMSFSGIYRRLRYAPFLCQVVVTRRCNLSCAYCTEFDQVSEPVPADLLRARIDKVAELGSFGLELTGGEPLLHLDLVPLVRHAAQYRFVMLGVITNGFLLSDRLVEGFNEAGLGDMQVSIDGVRPNGETQKALDVLRPKLERMAGRARFRVTLSAVIGAGAPSGEIETIVRFAREHGFRSRVLLRHGADGQLAADTGRLRAYAHVPGLIARTVRDSRRYRRQLVERGESPFRCRAGSRYLYVDEAGVVHWCAQTAAAFGVPLTDYSADDLRRQFYTYKTCNAGCTIGCARSCSMADRWFPQPREQADANRD